MLIIIYFLYTTAMMQLSSTLRIKTYRTTLKSTLFRVSSTSRPNFSDEISKKYFEFNRLEKDIYSWWERSGFFKPKQNEDNKESFVIPMPPPNVTGYLHMGHAIFLAIQDIMARFHRMRGKNTLWLPGTDHAGIATQLLVEKQLQKDGITRQSLGREQFLDKVWQWKKEKGEYISNQMRRLGASADWSMEKFTLDEDMSEAVTEAFIRLYEKGLVYKGTYMVNWSPNLQTAVSDLEVEYTEETGKLYFFKYMLEDGSAYVPVATTRPETILGDTAICVNPLDDRYREYIGKLVKVPMTNRTIPVIADDYVEMGFGTGALKITPAHDVNDYRLGKKHNLPFVNIMNKDGSINKNGGKYAGMDRFKCREEIWKDLSDMDIAIKVEDHLQRVPRSQRGGDVIEPMVSSQWFVQMKDMAARAIKAVEEKQLNIVPDRFEKDWFNWLGAENIQDWCISRQLWWGHRIPVYYVKNVDKTDINNDLPTLSDENDFIVARSYEEAKTIAIQKFGAQPFQSNQLIIEQDPDVLDTWFSSGLWPFATVGWPHSTNDDKYKKFYPATVLETGYDILFFWVARMVTMGLELTNQLPFKTIYLHGLVRDKDGQKMSKTKGNVIDPIDTIDAFGCDALRFALVTGATPGNDIPLSLDRVEMNRNFVNKLWNLGKFMNNVFQQNKNFEIKSTDFSFTREELISLPLPEQFILSKLHETTELVTESLEKFQFGEAGKLVNDFIWDEFADWFVEISKVHLRSTDITCQKSTLKVLLYTWEHSLKLLHPFMPFITEVLWQLLPIKRSEESLMVTDWPDYDRANRSDTALAMFPRLRNLVKSVRNIRTEYNVEASKKIPLTVISDTELLAQLKKEREVLAALMRLDEKEFHLIETTKKLSTAQSTIHSVIDDKLEAFLPQKGIIDHDRELARLLKQKDKLRKELQQFEDRMSKPAFVEKAPQHVVVEVQGKISELTNQLALVENSIQQLL